MQLKWVVCAVYFCRDARANEIRVTGCEAPKPVLLVPEVCIPDCVAERPDTLICGPLTVVQTECWPVALSGRHDLAVTHAELQETSHVYQLLAVIYTIEMFSRSHLVRTCSGVLCEYFSQNFSW